ncbi:MAG: ABC transporter permease [Erysipelotrichaceae bacterium]|nr:ABC transporter permease [Erysipelotrichaceae bacterium]
MNKKNEKLLIPFIAIILGILVGCIILIISGKSVNGLLVGLLKGLTGFDIYKPHLGFNLRYPGEFLVSAMPIMLTGLAVGFAYRCGMFNIGAEGQVIMGSLAVTMLAILVPMPKGIGAIVCLIVGALAGALWAFIPGLLKHKFNISEVVSGIMLNYTAMYGANYFLKILPGTNNQRTVDIPSSTKLGSSFLASLTGNSRFHWGFIVVIICVIAYWFIIEKTSFGFSLRATGFNKEGARYAGIKVDKSIILSIMISGALAGLAGAIVVQGTFGYGRVMTAADNYGFDGISVALVGSSNALGILFSGMLFALLKVSQPLLQINGIPREIGEIISSSIVFFVAIQHAIKYILSKLESKKHKSMVNSKGGTSK